MDGMNGKTDGMDKIAEIKSMMDDMMTMMGKIQSMMDEMMGSQDEGSQEEPNANMPVKDIMAMRRGQQK